MAIFWNVKEIARLMGEHELRTQQQVNEAAGLSRLTMYNILRAGPLTRIDVPTLEALARTFHCSPWALLEYFPDDSYRRR